MEDIYLAIDGCISLLETAMASTSETTGTMQDELKELRTMMERESEYSRTKNLVIIGLECVSFGILHNRFGMFPSGFYRIASACFLRDSTELLRHVSFGILQNSPSGAPTPFPPPSLSFFQYPSLQSFFVLFLSFFHKIPNI